MKKRRLIIAFIGALIILMTSGCSVQPDDTDSFDEALNKFPFIA